MRKSIIALAAFTAIAMMSGQASSTLLYGHSPNGGQLYQIDTATQTVTNVGSPDGARLGPEIEFSPDGSNIFFSGRASSPTTLKSINPGTGLTTGTQNLSGFPSGTDTLTGLEFVGSTLYGSAHQAGQNSNPGILVTVNTGTGALTTVGTMTGINRPVGGMDFFNGAMYAITSTNQGGSSLFTIDLGTGVATLVAALTISGVQTDAVSALTSASDGKMYAFRSVGGLENDFNLYSVNLSTGAMTAEFDLGIAMNALTAITVPIPAPGVLTLFGLGIIGLGYRRRKRNA